jgi:hypothetical protein
MLLFVKNMHTVQHLCGFALYVTYLHNSKPQKQTLTLMGVDLMIVFRQALYTNRSANLHSIIVLQTYIT